jgi:hypothetical protein
MAVVRDRRRRGRRMGMYILGGSSGDDGREIM